MRHMRSPIDESNILDGIRRILHSERKRWDMRFAVGGEAALRVCEVEKFEVVIFDRAVAVAPGALGSGLGRRGVYFVPFIFAAFMFTSARLDNPPTASI